MQGFPTAAVIHTKNKFTRFSSPSLYILIVIIDFAATITTTVIIEPLIITVTT